MQVKPDFPTHFDVHCRKSSTLDRLYVSLPPDSVFGISMRAYLASDPAVLSHRRLSDHGILVLELNVAMASRSQDCPIPDWICREHIFASTFANVMAVSRTPDDDQVEA